MHNQPVSHAPRNPGSYGEDTFPKNLNRADYTPDGKGGWKGKQPHKPFKAVGHDIQLQDAQVNSLTVTITTISGHAITGTIARRCKYTITVCHNKGFSNGMNEIFYKHAIESVLVHQVTKSVA